MTQQLNSRTNQIPNHEPAPGDERFMIPGRFYLESNYPPGDCGPGETDPPDNTGGSGSANAQEEEESTEQGGDIYTQSD